MFNNPLNQKKRVVIAPKQFNPLTHKRNNTSKATNRQNIVKLQHSTNRVFLRELTINDASVLMPLLDRQSCLNLAIKPILNLAQTERFICSTQSSNNKRLAILDDNQTIVGYVAYRLMSTSFMNNATILNNKPKDKPRIEISYLVGKTYRRRGIAYDGLTNLLQHLGKIFNDGCYLQANIMLDNHASQQLLEKLGFALLKGDNTHCKRYILTLYQSH